MNKKYIAIAAILAAVVVALGMTFAYYREVIATALALGLLWLVCNFDEFSSRKARCEQEQKNRDKAYLWLLWQFWQYFSSNEKLPFQPILDVNEFDKSVEYSRQTGYSIIRLHVAKSGFDAAKWSNLLSPLIRKHLAHFLYIMQIPFYRLVFWNWVDNGAEVVLVFLMFDDVNSYNSFSTSAAQTKPKPRAAKTAVVDEDF